MGQGEMKHMPTDLIQDASLDWSLTHIEKQGDTNLFPVPFEYAAIRHNWAEVKSELLSRDLSSYSINAAQRMLAPKPKMLFRAIHQLDPLDCLMFTAVVYEAARSIERHRVTASARTACSYRVAISPDGNFFSNGTGWADFHERSKELAQSGAFSHIVLADIADFYNQAYHHRIENALKSASVDEGRAKNIEAFLMQLTARQSRGLPVGPYASIILAEACLNGVLCP